MSKINLTDIANGDYDDTVFEPNQPSVKYKDSEFKERNVNDINARKRRDERQAKAKLSELDITTHEEHNILQELKNRHYNEEL